MTTTVRDLMETYSRPPLSIDNDGTTARKVWTEEYFPFQQQYVTVWPPQRQAIDAFLGSGTSRSDADSIGLDTPAYPLNVFPQVVATEGDVTRDFDQNIIPAVALAFSGNSARSRLRSNPRQIVPGAPALWLRSLVGSTTSKFVDYQIAMSHKIPSLQEAAVVGEMKKPKVIRRNEWAFEVHAGSVTLRLQQELRASLFLTRIA
ncbi:hypothetical protein UA08_09501 [Talaromyces atroroseus]|uniref:Uncharacterized protein n=1 Tax=Talaromyces atroroseus TaxID=1441469 RepID=A0A1Q5Q5Z0_TALAT|nr:hypothetical protein UA08_09501 [Talaromyces atroroseus]OKL55234.1 hypothetical protein UA08_09501 [Talaromyces atroroseus]